MNRNETTSLLRLRRELTGETFNDGTLDAWLRACQTTDPNEATHAMTEAARAGRVTLATFTERLPRHAGSDDTPPEYCVLCDGSGWVTRPPALAHNPRVCRPTEERPCMCSDVEPCRCTTGRTMIPSHRSIVAFNDRHRTGHGAPEPTTEPRRLDEPTPPPARLDLA